MKILISIPDVKDNPVAVHLLVGKAPMLHSSE